jgi:phenylalanyl-tRNA synthetase beta chain
MLISYNWLKNYVPLKEPVETVVSRLIHAGVEVANVRHLGKDISGVVVAELLSVEKHPQADRLSLTKVSTGKETFQVVCGAKNIAPGQKVPLAKVGAILPGNFEIKAAKIRGVESLGMLCSAKELGLAEDAEGILQLSPDAPLGQDLLRYMGLPDSLFELEITPNRADLLSHGGVAREVAALFNKAVRFPKFKKVKESKTTLSQLAKVSIEAKDLCRLYAYRVMEGVKIGPSPKWLAQTLEKMGQRPINNVVDVTNYVLLETGQPLHAFDLGKLHGSKIIVRQAKAGEKISLLDNTERELKGDMLVIADADRPVALAGIMGGSNSQVTGQTKTILLESALFLPGSVRKTARQLGISTDSSYRFERGVDPQGVKAALERAASLISEVAGGLSAKGTGSISTQKIKPVQIPYRPSRANSLLGLELPGNRQVEILKSLGCRIKGSSALKTVSVLAPSFRLDLTREIDLIEEIARLLGYDKIPAVAPSISSNFFYQEPAIPFEKQIRFALHQAGIHEAVNSSFLPVTFPQKLKLKDGHPLRQFQEIANPLADDQSALRPTLLPSLLMNTQLNLAHQEESVALYEMNKVFTQKDDGKMTEKFQVAVLLAGLSAEPSWQNPERKNDFYDIKGLAENLLDLCRIKGHQWEFGSGTSPYQSHQSFQVKNEKGGVLLWGGVLNPKVLKGFEIHSICLGLEIELGLLGQAPQKPWSFRPLPKFPEAWRDIALVVPDGVTSIQVAEAIEKMGQPQLKKVRLFDLYHGPNLPNGFRSLAYRLHFQAAERTLTDVEVTEKVSQIVNDLKTRYSIALR